MSTPFSNEITYDAIQKNIAAFLAGVTFPTQFIFENPASVTVDDAKVSLHPTAESLIDFRSNFFPYDGVISQLMVTYDDLFSVRTYLGNLWSYAQVSVVPNSFYTENTSASELLTKLREAPYFSENTESNLITYKGHEGFVVCDNSSWSQVTDEKNATHSTAFCEVIFLVGKNNSHFLSLMFLSDKRKKSDLYVLMRDYLDKYVTVSDLGSTNL